MHRIFIDFPAGDGFDLSKEDHNHIVNSLRMGQGDEIEVLASDGLFLGILVDVERRSSRLEIRHKIRDIEKPKLDIVLYQALAKGDNMDLIIQKATELGVTEIIPIMTERTVVRLDGKRATNRVERLQKIADSASAQSKRDYLPLVKDIIEIEQIDEEVLIFFDEEADSSLREGLSKLDHKRLAYIIGPEGGFSPEERQSLVDKGALRLSLGKRILRTETAAIAAAAIIQYELGDMGDGK